jgi:hypothetical protein
MSLEEFKSIYDNAIKNGSYTPLPRASTIQDIHINIDHLTREHLRELLSFFVEVIGKSKLHEKGTGTLVRYQDISDEHLRMVHCFILHRYEKIQQEFHKHIC